MATKNAEHYMRLNADEREHEHPDCGCRMKLNEDVGGVSLYQCPTHAAAPEVLAALKAAAEVLLTIAEQAGDMAYWNLGGEGYAVHREARAAIRKAKG